MKFLLSFILIFILVSLSVCSQEIPDSLLEKIENDDNDTIRITGLNQVSDFFSQTDFQEALVYAQQALDHSQQIEYSLGVASAYFRLGTLNQYLGNYLQAIQCFSSAMSIFEELQNKRGLAICNSSFGWLWSEYEDYEKARTYFKSCLDIMEEIGDDTDRGAVYLNYGAVLDELGIHDSARYYYETARKIVERLQDTSLIVASKLDLGYNHKVTGGIEQAESLYYECLLLCRAKGNIIDQLAESYLQIGNIHLIKEEFDSAISYFDSALYYASEIGLSHIFLEAYKGLSAAYENMDEFKLAFQYKTLYDSLRDLEGEEKRRLDLAQMEWERERELENKLMAEETRRQKLLRTFALIAFALVLILAGVLYRNFRMKQKSNQLLADIDQMKSRMFSNISHEFRTPLTLILGPLEEMLQEKSGTTMSSKILKMMHRNAEQLLSLVNQMMDLSKMDAGQLKLELVEGDVIQAVKLMVLAFTSLAEKKNINYSYQLPGQSLITWHDPDKMEKIINNLLSNAFKFTGEQGKVIVGVTTGIQKKSWPVPPFASESPTLEIAVTDTGKGIPKDQLNKVFDRFHQVEGSFELGSAGTGIGLALTKELVDLMHGKISVESILGAGSRFTVKIPLGTEHLGADEFTYVENAASALAGREEKPPGGEDKILPGGEEKTLPGEKEETFPVEKPEPETPPDDKYTVLIVEDHADILQHIREGMPEHHILEAANGREGLNQAIENIPDLVITDLMMPEMDGVELCKNLKTDERTSHIPVIMLTAKASIEDRIEGLETGADAYVTKPFSMKELRVRIHNLIEQRRKLRERFASDVSLGPKDIAVTSADERFLQRIIGIIEENMSDIEFDVAGLSDQVAMSRMQLYRKIKALTNQTPSEFIRTIRLKRAAQLMREKFGNIAEITYEVGFNHPSYFAKSFKELFGESPSDYTKNH
jgi:signal transduction histidine kinase/DNA-binding response OmpR family regulator